MVSKRQALNLAAKAIFAMASFGSLTILMVTSAAPSSGAVSPITNYIEFVDSGIQDNCVACHKAGGVAPASGAGLVLGMSPEGNHEAFSQYLSDPSVNKAWVLSKVTGGEAHGGGTILSEGSGLYVALERYLTQLEGDY